MQSNHKKLPSFNSQYSRNTYILKIVDLIHDEYTQKHSIGCQWLPTGIFVGWKLRSSYVLFIGTLEFTDQIVLTFLAK